MAIYLKKTLPSLLTDYLPEYEEKSSHVINDNHEDSKINSRISKRQARRNEDHMSINKQDTPTKKKNHSTQNQDKYSTDHNKKQQHDFQMFRDWQKVKVDGYNTELSKLKEKIYLQKELITVQKLSGELKQQKQESIVNKTRDELKQQKLNMHKMYSEICRQSIESDRNNLQEKRANKELKKNNSAKLDKSKIPNSEGQSLASSSYISNFKPLNISTIKENQAIKEENEENTNKTSSEEQNVNNEVVDFTNAPDHILQLVELFGEEEAASFFKIKDDNNFTSSGVDLMKPDLDTSASGLWSVLRENSNLKLINEDSNISYKHKQAYASFMRQCLVHRKVPIERNYCKNADVPNLPRLMDHSKINKAQTFSHKLGIMYRASRINKDKALILLHNNPIETLLTSDDPDNPFTDLGVDKYIPSMYDDTIKENKSYKNDNENLKIELKPRFDDNCKIIFMKDKSLTGNESYFSDQRKTDAKEMMVQPVKPPGVTTSVEIKLYPGGGSVSHREVKKPQDVPQRRSISELGHISSCGSNATWEPLTLNALLDYTNYKPCLGEGHFNHGKAKVWNTKSITSI